MALCCFGVAWYEECHRLVCEAERMLPPDGEPQPKGTLGSAEAGDSPGVSFPNRSAAGRPQTGRPAARCPADFPATGHAR